MKRKYWLATLLLIAGCSDTPGYNPIPVNRDNRFKVAYHGDVKSGGPHDRPIYTLTDTKTGREYLYVEGGACIPTTSEAE